MTQQQQEPPAAARLAEPGDEHRRLETLVGTWRAHLQLHPAPGAAGDIVAADIAGERRWLVEGRYLQEDLRGELGGAPYHRIGLLTFHRLLCRYQMVTADNLDTGFMPYESRDIAAGDPDDRVELFGSFIYGGAGADIVGVFYRTRYVIDLPALGQPDRHGARMFFAPPSQPEFLFCAFDFERV